MKIDKVERVWEDLEKAYSNSKIKSRRDFLKGLVSFNGSAGAVKGLEATLKLDLDGSTEAINRYNAICGMLESAEGWLLNHQEEIPDLNAWLEKLAEASVSINHSKLKTTYTASTDTDLLQAIQFGYVFPGMYGKMQTPTFNTSIDGYYFFQDASELQQAVQQTLQTPNLQRENFLSQFIHALNEIMLNKELTLPCVFVDRGLLRNPIFKYKKVKSVKEQGVAIINGSEDTIDANYEIGKVCISAGTNLLTVIIGGD